MRPLYFFLRCTLPYAQSVFFRRTKTLNAQKKFNAQTIFVSNHPSAFMDPLVAANYQIPILYFVTRGDIFKWWLHPVTWASHMVPIFRKAQDGADSHEKNKDSFEYLKKTLLRKKSLILFGEGYTDDIFIRSLKPVKKGPARIAFDAMESSGWKEDIKVQAIGLNYSHPKYFRSDVLLSLSDCIHLKDYRDLYNENPQRAITELTREIQREMRAQITCIDDKSLADFLEHLLILSRKGMNHFHVEPSVSLENRFYYSRNLANRINTDYAESNEDWTKLRANTKSYFANLKKQNINENWVALYSRTGHKNLMGRILLLVLGLPFALLGAVHNFIPYILIKTFVEKTFKRSVFWSGVKMILTSTLSALYNIPIFFLFTTYIYDSYLLATAYYLTVPAISGVFGYYYFKQFAEFLKISKTDRSLLEQLAQKRKALIDKMHAMDLL